MREIIDGIRAEAPGLAIAVRLSAFDVVPHRKGADGRGVPEAASNGYPVGFGLHRRRGDGRGARARAGRCWRMLRERDVRWVCVTAGSPYYCPHAQRPAVFPPSDGYEPPEDPLHGVARQIDATARLKAAFPDMVFVGTAYSYLQEWLPHVAQYNVREGLTDFVGLGRMVLSYPDLPADVLERRAAQAQGDLPHVQRLHDRSAAGTRLGLLSARSVLPQSSRRRAVAATPRRPDRS